VSCDSVNKKADGKENTGLRTDLVLTNLAASINMTHVKVEK
jgi:hypothetical protein